jgi:hypothetical protein
MWWQMDKGLAYGAGFGSGIATSLVLIVKAQNTFPCEL